MGVGRLHVAAAGPAKRLGAGIERRDGKRGGKRERQRDTVQGTNHVGASKPCCRKRTGADGRRAGDGQDSASRRSGVGSAPPLAGPGRRQAGPALRGARVDSLAKEAQRHGPLPRASTGRRLRRHCDAMRNVRSLNVRASAMGRARLLVRRRRPTAGSPTEESARCGAQAALAWTAEPASDCSCAEAWRRGTAGRARHSRPTGGGRRAAPSAAVPGLRPAYRSRVVFSADTSRC